MFWSAGVTPAIEWRKPMRWHVLWISAILLHLSCAAFAEEQEIPTVDGHLGVCSTAFTVTDSASKPIYNAKIMVDVRYGFLGSRKMSLEVGTNGDGKAKVAGLPEKLKNPLQFEIVSNQLTKKIVVDVAAKCNESVQVKLEPQQ
jgi:hypothetical protein